MFRGFIPILIILLIEVYSFMAVRTLTRSKVVLGSYIIISLIILAYLVYSMLTFDRGHGQNQKSLFTIGIFLMIYVPKLIITLILVSEDIFRLIQGIINHFLGNNDDGTFLPSRRKFVSQVALGLATIPFASFLYGMTLGKYNFKVRKQTLYFPDLPDSFDGFTLTQISDIHSGSLNDAEKIEYAISLINEQQSDLVLFTGDIVNSLANEMHPWIDTFKKIHTPKFGKYSILGNHDYGEYYNWDSQAEKAKNFQEIKDLHQQINFKLLLNENVKLTKGSESIRLIGVENWGLKFKQAGDLKKASQGVSKEEFKILMSHDPSHWDTEVQNDDNNYHLTLSGHTHGFQFGIEVPGFIKWSPVQYVYKHWAGLYENMGRYIYINRGFGFHGYSGRVGIMPEITVIKLKKGEKVA